MLRSIFGSSYFSIAKEVKFRKKILGRRSFSKDNIDEKLSKYLNFNGGFYVELGANDGITNSNTAYLEYFKEWSGILIEPLPHRFVEACLRRNKNNSVVCAACVDSDFQGDFVAMRNLNLMSISEDLITNANGMQDSISRGIRLMPPDDAYYEFGAKARTLNSILIENNAPRCIDFLSLDVEGAEISVLRGIDFQCFNFRYILVETKYFNLLDDFLTDFHYKFVEKITHHDYLFKRVEP